MTDDESTCALPDCDEPIKRKEFCYGHYMKQWRYGTPTPEFPSKVVDLVGQSFGGLLARLFALRHPDEYPFSEGRIVSSKGIDIALELSPLPVAVVPEEPLGSVAAFVAAGIGVYYAEWVVG